jgi:hypothetical protein
LAKVCTMKINSLYQNIIKPFGVMEGQRKERDGEMKANFTEDSIESAIMCKIIKGMDRKDIARMHNVSLQRIDEIYKAFRERFIDPEENKAPAK